LPATFIINTPPKIALDFAGAENGLGKSILEAAEGDLRRIDVIQAGQRTRLVLNLNQMMGYQAQIEGNDLLITLQGKATATTLDVAKPAHFAEAKATASNNSVRDIDFHRGRNGEGRIEIDLSSANIDVDIKQQGKALHIDLQQTSLPANLRRKVEVGDFATPVQTVDAYPQGDGVKLVVEPKGNWEYSAYQTDTKLIVEIKALVEDANKMVKGNQTGYAGDKLTLNFQNIDTREALNVIADFTGLNMVISDSVSGSLTLRLKEVPWDQALDIILDSKGLDRRKNGNVIQVAPREELAAKEKNALSARQEITELEVTRTESFQLSYAKAVDLEKLLSNDKQRILSKRGSVLADLRTNMIFVQDTPTYLEDVRKLVKQIDIPVRQVMIEARFIEAGDSFSRTLGGKINASGPINRPANSSAATATGNVNLPGASTGTGGLLVSLFGAGDTQTLSMEINASDVDGKTKNIASPRVVTGDKAEATIESGVEIPYQQGGTATTAVTIAFKKAVLSLKVTPQITPDDRVNMKVAVSQDVVGTIYAGVPSINTKQVSTQVLVDNGGTVVIGGIYTQDDSDTKQQVPLFGDIPILGWLFKSDTTIKNKKELLIFITPRILKESLSVN
jgi:type IV pilus assembly protein PilQ